MLSGPLRFGRGTRELQARKVLIRTVLPSSTTASSPLLSPRMCLQRPRTRSSPCLIYIFSFSNFLKPRPFPITSCLSLLSPFPDDFSLFYNLTYMIMMALSIVFAGTQECRKIQYSFDFERPPKACALKGWSPACGTIGREPSGDEA